MEWSREALRKLESARDIRPDADLADQAAATLIGLDARLVAPPYRSPIGLSSVAYGPGGKRLLAGGHQLPARERVELSPALLWDENRARAPAASRLSGAGPVAFAGADTPLQLVLPTGNRWSLVLWSVGTNEQVTEMPLPLRGAEDVVAALSPDARHAAASVTSARDKDGKRTGQTLVWAIDPKKPGAAAKPLAEWGQPASALAFSPDGEYVAAGTRDGTVTVRATTGAGDVLTVPGNLPVLAVAFGRNFRKSASDQSRLVKGGVTGWLLAVGGRGGVTTVWDLETRTEVSVLRGSSHYVNAVAFTPDGSSLVTAGHSSPIVWDVSTGRPVLHLQGHFIYQTGVAISPDGRRVAVTSSGMLSGPGSLHEYVLDDDRGIRSYRGLSGPVQFVWLSPSGKWVAALAHNWQVGVWERASGRLVYVWDVQGGWSADNAALAFDETEESILFSSGERAVRLNIASGERTGRWPLGRGLDDNLVVRPGKPPLLLRRERVGPTGFGVARPKESLLARELLDDDTTRETFDTSAIPGTITSGCVFTGGKYLLVSIGSGNAVRTELFDSTTMRPVPLPPALPIEKANPFFVTGDGRLLLVQGHAGKQYASCVYTLPEMSLRASHRGDEISAIDDAGKLGVTTHNEGTRGLNLYRIGEERSLVTFDIGRQLSSAWHHISRDGQHAHWGRFDGTVCVADVNRCLQQVAPFRRE